MIYHDRSKIINNEQVNKVSNLFYSKLRGNTRSFFFYQKLDCKLYIMYISN